MKKIAEIIAESDILDEEFYRNEYSDTEETDILEHFCTTGIEELRKPNRDFDPVWYREYYDDIKENGIHPVIHYILYGKDEGRFISGEKLESYILGIFSESIDDDDLLIRIREGKTAFHKDYEPYNEDKYLQLFPDIREAIEEGLFQSGFEHFRKHGYAEIVNGEREWIKRNRNSSLKIDIDESEESIETLIKKYSSFFTNDFIRFHLGTDTDDELFATKYTEYIEKKGIYPRVSAYFDPVFYMSKNQDVSQSNSDPLIHFLIKGIAEKRDPHPLIDISFIEKETGESINDINRFTRLIESGTRPSAYFDPSFYLGKYPDIAAAHIPALYHYIIQGANERRTPFEEFDYDIYIESRGLANDTEGLAVIIDFANHGDRLQLRFGNSFDYDYYKEQINEEAGNRRLFRHYILYGKESGLLPKREKIHIDRVNYLVSEELYHKTKENIDKNLLKGRAEIETISIKDEDAERLISSLTFPNPDEPLISIVIPVYNAFKELTELLMSIEKYTVLKNYEVLILDDASEDSRIERTLADHNSIKYIKNIKNRGFVKSVNRAVSEVNGKYILLLNSDIQLLNDISSILLERLSKNKNIALCGPKILFPDGKLQEAGCLIHSNCQTEMTGFGDDPNDGRYSFDRYVDYISGACWMFEKSLFKELGGLDTEYSPAYVEDVDFCTGAVKRGKKILYVSDALIMHHLSISSQSLSNSYKIYHSAKNKKRFIQKHSGFYKKHSEIKPIAFYLPQFHTIPQNDYWWGKNFTEWRAASDAKPQFKGHYQPHIPADLGFYDLMNRDTFTEQAKLAKRYGIEGFCFYYYNFGEFELLEGALENFIDSEADINFCLCWANENWTRRWDGQESDILVEQKGNDPEIFLNVLRDMERFLKDSRYIRIDGKPMILIYRASMFDNIKEKLISWRRYWREKHNEELYICIVDSMERADGNAENPENLGFDAAVEFPVHHVTSRYNLKESERLDGVEFKGAVIDYADAVEEICSRKHPGYKRIPGCFPSWDNTPRRGSEAVIFKDAHPSLFQLFLEYKSQEAMLLSGDERMIFINAWNEWGEGAHLEPDLKYGHSGLSIIENSLKGYR